MAGAQGERTDMFHNEYVIFRAPARLFAMAAPLDGEDLQLQWENRGSGQLRMLQHPETHQVRVFMLNKSGTVVANHAVESHIEMTHPQATGDKRPQAQRDQQRAWVYVVEDYSASDQESERLQLALRFKTVEAASRFADAFDTAKQLHQRLQSPSGSLGDEEPVDLGDGDSPQGPMQQWQEPSAQAMAGGPVVPVHPESAATSPQGLVVKSVAKATPAASASSSSSSSTSSSNMVPSVVLVGGLLLLAVAGVVGMHLRGPVLSVGSWRSAAAAASASAKRVAEDAVHSMRSWNAGTGARPVKPAVSRRG